MPAIFLSHQKKKQFPGTQIRTMTFVGSDTQEGRTLIVADTIPYYIPGETALRVRKNLKRDMEARLGGDDISSTFSVRLTR